MKYSIKITMYNDRRLVLAGMSLPAISIEREVVGHSDIMNDVKEVAGTIGTLVNSEVIPLSQTRGLLNAGLTAASHLASNGGGVVTTEIKDAFTVTISSPSKVSERAKTFAKEFIGDQPRNPFDGVR